jgi:hypothetical protein
LLTLAPLVAAECVRYQPPPPGTPPGLDGHGSFGELQDTVTLDCLKYVGSSIKHGVEFVQIRDELGKIHQLKVGSYMGENTGLIVKIDSEAIYLRQMVKRGEDWEPLDVKFLKH